MRTFFDNLESAAPQNGVQLSEAVQPVAEPELRRNRNDRTPHSLSAKGIKQIAGNALVAVTKQRKG